MFEKVNREVPLAGIHWFFDHAETISPRNIDRVKALGGGIAVQHRMAYQGEDFASRYGKEMTAEAPPIRRILAAGVPLGAGTDATRVASYNPWVSLYWLVTGKTIAGTTIYPKENRLDRTTALRLWTEANTWFSNEEGKKGAIKAGQLADLAVLSADYMSVRRGRDQEPRFGADRARRQRGLRRRAVQQARAAAAAGEPGLVAGAQVRRLLQP